MGYITFTALLLYYFMVVLNIHDCLDYVYYLIRLYSAFKLYKLFSNLMQRTDKDISVILYPAIPLFLLKSNKEQIKSDKVAVVIKNNRITMRRFHKADNQYVPVLPSIPEELDEVFTVQEVVTCTCS